MSTISVIMCPLSGKEDQGEILLLASSATAHSSSVDSYLQCDKGNPCSQCVLARAKCTGSDVSGIEDVPRSITQFLRDDIRRIETKLSQDYAIHGQTTNPRNDERSEQSSLTPRNLETRHPSQLLARAKQCSSIAKIIGSTTPSPGSKADIPRNMMGLTSSRVFASNGLQNGTLEGMSAAANDQTPGLISVKNLGVIPPRIVRTLVKVFIEKVHSLLPMVYEPTLWTQVRRILRVIHDDKLTRVPPDFDFLIVHVVLAISVSLGSASSGHGPQRMAFSETLFQDGVKHLSSPSIFPTEMSELQATLLILHYGTINPRCASVWMLSGSAMRLCLKLGLHREPNDSMVSGDWSADLRRRLFWMSYCFDRHVCAALQYPISLSDAAINSHHFSALDDKVFAAEDAVSMAMAPSKEPALHWLEYRQIHSDMVEVHFRGKPFGHSWDEWLSEMEGKLRSWYHKHRETYVWTETAYHNALTYLHRPSPLTPKPTPRSLLIAFENACAVASSYGKDIHAGYFRRPWLAAHHTFGSAIIVLFCLRHGSKLILTKFSPQEISAMTTLFSLNLQNVSSQVWPEVSRCLEVYHRLLEPLIPALMSGTDPGLTFTRQQDEELAHLLYPGTTRFEALSWENTSLMSQLTMDIDMTNADAFGWDFSRFDEFAGDETAFDFLDGQFQTPEWTEPAIVT
ncbi:uncharacterized protein Z518_06594 [Rhinocladiella mackenziei CBS 650.93]|uniref:Xylanolytic transcriptional activator regulatory domain-containing protein n=1 Tax=Rhinocladiella mackenziei CBS 650.93 TaxID=1442369 RepID=A0A0D2IB46_9EURO|nr:uncharacterized protein Z518_06594 [Rhinocladiella mackenziei CBS 650.93]KIX03044.1 hypothetical protein Z518_06594 [Rhinocladiella mackenziei CBS 650.93]